MREFKDSVTGNTPSHTETTQLPAGTQDTSPTPQRENETVR
jgi:hypothetical protein